MKLDTAQRRALPAKDFAGPDRSYPVNDASHARDALARVAQAKNAGRMSAGRAANIRAKANAVLGARNALGSRG